MKSSKSTYVKVNDSVSYTCISIQICLQGVLKSVLLMHFHFSYTLLAVRGHIIMTYCSSGVYMAYAQRKWANDGRAKLLRATCNFQLVTRTCSNCSTRFICHLPLGKFLLPPPPPHMALMAAWGHRKAHFDGNTLPRFNGIKDQFQWKFKSAFKLYHNSPIKLLRHVWVGKE